jgi:hypothetical protein
MLGGSGHERTAGISSGLRHSGGFAPKILGFIALMPGLTSEGGETRKAGFLWRISDFSA